MTLNLTVAILPTEIFTSFTGINYKSLLTQFSTTLIFCAFEPPTGIPWKSFSLKTSCTLINSTMDGRDISVS